MRYMSHEYVTRMGKIIEDLSVVDAMDEYLKINKFADNVVEEGKGETQSESSSGKVDGNADKKKHSDVLYRDKRYYWQKIVPVNTRRSQKFDLVLADLPIDGSPRTPFMNYFDHDDQIICLIRTSYEMLTEEGNLILVVDPCRFDFVKEVLNE